MFDHDDTGNRKLFTRRLLVAGGVSTAAFAALGWRFFDLQVRNGGRYAPLADENRIAFTVLAPKRGRILDRLGREIAGNKQTFRATLVPALAGDVKHVLKLFSEIVPLDEAAHGRIAKRLKRQRRNDAIMLVGHLTFDQVAKININAPYLPGVKTEIVWKRVYDGGRAIGHVAGYVSYPNKIESTNDPVLRLPGMRVGRTGIESGFNDLLQGRGGTQRVEVDARGSIIRDLGMTPPTDGADVTLTLDKDLQARLFERVQASGRAACVVLDILTGHIAAMSASPSYDPTPITEGLSKTEWSALADAADTPLINRATAGLYEPDRLYHVITALAALDSGVVTAREKIKCTGSYRIGDQFHACGHDQKGHGLMTLDSALRVGCYHYISEIAQRTGAAAISSMSYRLGFGTRYKLGLSPQQAGVVADPDWRSRNGRNIWSGADTARFGLGRGGSVATPLQMAVFSARLASGRDIRPLLATVAWKDRAKSGTVVSFSGLDVTHDHLGLVREAIGWPDMSRVLKHQPGETRDDGVRLVGLACRSSQSADRDPDRLSSPDDGDATVPQHAHFVGVEQGADPRFVVAAVIENAPDSEASVRSLAEDALRLTNETVAATLSPDPSVKRG